MFLLFNWDIFLTFVGMNKFIKISTRLVIILPYIVLKFPLSRRGYLQSKNESFIWGKYKTTYPLATLHWEFLGIVCMKRYTTIIQPLHWLDPRYCFGHEIPRSTVMLLKSIIKEFDFNSCDLYNSDNWGTENGVYYLLDYGINQQISTLYKK